MGTLWYFIWCCVHTTLELELLIHVGADPVEEKRHLSVHSNPLSARLGAVSPRRQSNQFATSVNWTSRVALMRVNAR